MKRKHMAMVLLATVLSACNNHENIIQETDSMKEIPMTVTTNLNESVISRAGITNDNLTRHTFLFSSTPEGEEEGSSYIYTDLLAEYSNGEWLFSKDGGSIVPVWKDQTTNIKVTALRAVSPNNGVYSLVANPNETTDIQANDWLYFSGTINPTLAEDDNGNNQLALKNGAIPINFKHLNSKIDINLSFVQGINELNIESVTIDGTKISATLTDGVPSVSGEQTTSVNACFVEEDAHNYEVILLPQTATLEVEVKAKDEDEQTYVFYWTSSSVTLESGKKYTLELTLDYNNVDGLIVSRGAWASGGESQSLNAK